MLRFFEVAFFALRRRLVAQRAYAVSVNFPGHAIIADGAVNIAQMVFDAAATINRFGSLPGAVNRIDVNLVESGHGIVHFSLQRQGFGLDGDGVWVAHRLFRK